jgi:catechol 2,3-dioxygenase-like lactoylglutathione lyase family enzyme
VDPKGTVVEVFRERELPKAPCPSKGIAPFKLGHVAFNCVDVKKITNFYCDVLGFRVSDWFGEIFSFLRCGPDHHTINLLDAQKIRMNHIAFELRDWSHLQTACDFLSAHGYSLIWGPGRHGPGHNLYSYHKNPDGHVVELFAELDRMHDESLGYFEPRPWHADRPQRPKVWPLDPKSANLWGIGPPHEMME